MAAYLRKCWGLPEKPDHIVFYNSGVKLLLKETGILDALTGLFESGVDLHVCGTCIAYYKIENEIAIGRVSNMEEIAVLLLESDSVITI